MKPIASLSLDLDNLWSYMKVHNDPGWESFPSYLDLVVPRVLDFLESRRQAITFFVVGQDAAIDRNREALGRIGVTRHEVGNHSFAHEPWLHLYTRAQVDDEIARAEDAIQRATGRRPVGFRGPGFSVSTTVLEVLAARGYRFDASTLPTFIGPLARTYYFMTARLGKQEREQRGALFGTVRDGLRPVTPYRWSLPSGASIIEIPVTVFPVARIPFHLSYVLYLSTFSEKGARAYFRAALEACLRTGVEPSILMHPLDFLGGDDVGELAFFPAMNLPGKVKLQRVSQYLSDLTDRFEALPMGSHCGSLELRTDLKVRKPDFADATVA